MKPAGIKVVECYHCRVPRDARDLSLYGGKLLCPKCLDSARLEAIGNMFDANVEAGLVAIHGLRCRCGAKDVKG